MTDYYSLITRAVEGLDTSTREARWAVYERARKAVEQLRSNQPALLEADITKERLALEGAIRKVEAEAARKSRTETRKEPCSSCFQVAAAGPRRSASGRFSGGWLARRPRALQLLPRRADITGPRPIRQIKLVANAQPLGQRRNRRAEQIEITANAQPLGQRRNRRAVQIEINRQRSEVSCHAPLSHADTGQSRPHHY
jgi:hypothetical protein